MSMTMRERRQRGLTLRNLVKVSRQLKESGELTSDMPRDEMAELILEAVVAEDPKAFAEVGLDWDAIIAFIEKLLPLILTIISLF